MDSRKLALALFATWLGCAIGAVIAHSFITPDVSLANQMTFVTAALGAAFYTVKLGYGSAPAEKKPAAESSPFRSEPDAMLMAEVERLKGENAKATDKIRELKQGSPYWMLSVVSIAVAVMFGTILVLEASDVTKLQDHVTKLQQPFSSEMFLANGDRVKIEVEAESRSISMNTELVDALIKPPFSSGTYLPTEARFEIARHYWRSTSKNFHYASSEEQREVGKKIINKWCGGDDFPNVVSIRTATDLSWAQCSSAKYCSAKADLDGKTAVDGSKPHDMQYDFYEDKCFTKATIREGVTIDMHGHHLAIEKSRIEATQKHPVVGKSPDWQYVGPAQWMTTSGAGGGGGANANVGWPPEHGGVYGKPTLQTSAPSLKCCEEVHENRAIPLPVIWDRCENNGDGTKRCWQNGVEWTVPSTIGDVKTTP